MLRTTLALLTLASAFPAFAQPAPDQPGSPETRPPFAHIREVCGADMQKYCADAPHERGARRQCMTANQSNFSKPCQDAMAQMQAWRQSHGGDAGGRGPQ